MTYTPSVPQSGQTLGQTRDPILTNFTLINQAFGSNHVPLTTNATGLHTHVDMTAQAADPATPSPVVSHYSKQVGGITEWFFKREAPGNEVIRMSRGTPIPLANGYTFLPGGLLLQWGTRIGPGSVSFPVSFTGNPFYISALVNYTSPAAVTGLGNTGATLSGFGVGNSVYYLTIGF